MIRTIELERRFFKNQDEWEWMLSQLNIDNKDAETVEVEVDLSTVEVTEEL